jgi:predicted nucleotidyltransferase
MQDNVINSIRIKLKEVEPSAIVILYGSFARGDNHEGSDIDLLILIEGESANREVQKRIKYPLYEIEFETGQLISPLVFARKDWETRHRMTPFFDNISREGILL